MNPEAKKVQNTYLLLLLLNTLAASFIWGINTLFLLDAGLSNLEAFAANAFFTAGQVIFEVPTGIVADRWGRRASYLLGAFTLMASTLLYLLMWQIKAPFWAWGLSSAFLGLGFTFFSGATEAWLVDALHFTKFKGSLESVFAKGQVVGGIAMLTGSVSGGLIAQATNLGVPYILRGAVLGVTFVLAFFLMKDLGFTPKKTDKAVRDMQLIFKNSIKHGLRNRPVRWIMLAAPFTTGVSFYAFYATQPYLLQLYGNEKAYGIAGLTAAIVAAAQIVGGIAGPYFRRLFKRRTTAMAIGVLLTAGLLALIGLVPSFWVAVALIVLWGLIFAAITPIRQTYLNGLIPSEQRATVLSFDSLMGSSGGVVIQPILGRAADAWSYGTSYILAAGFQFLALPFVLLARKENTPSDKME
jgi:MFS family permease